VHAGLVPQLKGRPVADEQNRRVQIISPDLSVIWRRSPPVGARKNAEVTCRGTLMVALILLAIFIEATLLHAADAGWKPTIPKVWIASELDDLDVPVSRPEYSQKFVSPDYYYRIPTALIYKSYPVYALGREPAGYLDKLKRLARELAFDPARLKTKQDWIRAGEIVFDAPTAYDVEVSLTELNDPEWYRATGVPIAKDGTLPWVRYVIRSKGQIQVGNLSCGFCHTRVLAGGTVVKGAQTNFSFDRAIAFRDKRRATPEQMRSNWLGLFSVQWATEAQQQLERASVEDILAAHAAIPPGVFARNRSSPYYPPAVPDLIGIANRRYLDRTGATRHRSVVDLMRYASLAQGIEFLSSFGGFIPIGDDNYSKLPPPETQERFSDEQLFAVAQYLYSLTPPANPNPKDAKARLGRRIFHREGCAVCHTPPHYTNNRLLPVSGFQVPTEHLGRYDILNVPIDTDSRLTLQTRRGTGYYKVPSLRGLWYRSAFEHNGSVSTLEDWFDARRLQDGYEPSGFKGFGVKNRAVRGHQFGLELTSQEKEALIAFLKTL
jgi:hypothetical protein